MKRRTFLRGTGLTAAAIVTGEFWNVALAAAAVPGLGPYGPLGAVDANGIRLPAGFSSRVIGRSGEKVAGTTHTWHSAPDGGGCFAAPGGGWIYVSNSEVSSGNGGVSAVRFSPAGTITGAYPILVGTSRNCAGGVTPWGTWLSCEENGVTGQVYECQPQQSGQGVARPALGRFSHEAAAVDPRSGDVYLTEDSPDGRLYRFVPTVAGDLSSGNLYAASVTNGAVTWVQTSNTAPDRSATTSPFNGGEGTWFGNDVVYFTTKGDRRVWELSPATNTLVVLHDCAATPTGALDAVDNITVHVPSGDVYVAEDGGNLELCLFATMQGGVQVAPFLRFAGPATSEVTGPAFSPDGTRLYVSSQRGIDSDRGITYEITGPFRTAAPTVTVTGLVPRALGQGASWRTVKLSGSGFSAGTTVSCSPPGVIVKSVQVVSSTALTLMVSVPATATVGARDVTVSTAGGATAARAAAFAVNPAPAVTSIAPATTARGRTGVVVDVVGENFAAGIKASLSGSGITDVVVTRIDAHLLRLTMTIAADAAIGPRSLTLTNTDAGVSTAGSVLAVVAGDPPTSSTVTSLVPHALGQGASWRSVKLSGAGLAAGARVSIAGTGVTVTSVQVTSPTLLKMLITVAPGAAVGPRDVTVTNTDGTTAVGALLFTVDARPSVTSVTPLAVERGRSGVTLTVLGANFASGVRLAFGGTGITVSAVNRVDSTRLQVAATVDASAAVGARPMTITNLDAGVVTVAGAIDVT